MNSLHLLLVIGLLGTVWFGRDQQLRARKLAHQFTRAQRAYAKLDNDYQQLWQAHEVALEDCQAMTDALVASMAQRHPAKPHLSVIRGG